MGRGCRAWKNVRYGRTLRPKPLGDPVHLLGNGKDLVQFQQDFCSWLWLTFPSRFLALPGIPWTTNCSPQVLLAQRFMLYLLGWDGTWPEAFLELELGVGHLRN